MTSTKPLLRLCAFALPILAAPLVAQNVKTDYDHTTNFTSYHTYSWKQVHTSDPLNEQRLKDQVDRDLGAKGWHSVPDGGDVSLTAVGSTKDQQEYTSFYDGLGGGGGGGFGWRRGWGGGGFGESTTTVQNIPVGSLVIDVYDSSSKKLLWRGMASDTLSNNPDKNTRKLDKAIDKLFNKFPPKGAA